MLRRVAFLLGCAVAVNAAAQGLFDDNEARRRIDLLRQEVTENQRQVAEQLKKLDAAVSGASDRSALIQLATQVENLSNEMARMRGIELPSTAACDVPPRTLRMLTSGPGRLCQALAITRPRDNGKDLTKPSSGLWMADDGFVPSSIRTTSRIGITKAAEQPLRYVIAGNPFVSKQSF